jgi:hypothetical protein
MEIFNLTFFSAGQLTWDRLLELLQHLKYTKNELTWRYGFQVFDELISRLKMTPAFNKLRNLIADAIDNRGGYDEDTSWNYK